MAGSSVPQPPSTVNAKYAPLSKTKPLAESEKIADLYAHNTGDKYFIQRLTERAYFLGGNFYTMVFYVGDTGVILFDAPEGLPGPQILEAVAEVTDLPISVITYSHNHADHIISAGAVVEDAKAKGRDIRIISTDHTKAKMDRFKSSLTRPTETVSWPTGSFEFEGKKFQYDGFKYGCHCDDVGVWLLVDEKVSYVPDLMNGDQPIFYKFGASEQCCYYRDNIKQLGALDWIHHVGGHGNVGSKKDIDFVLKYLTDLENTALEVKATETFAMGEIVENNNNHAVLMTEWLKACCTAVADRLRPKYGQFYGFEYTVPSNVEMILLSSISYR